MATDIEENRKVAEFWGSWLPYIEECIEEQLKALKRNKKKSRKKK